MIQTFDDFLQSLTAFEAGGSGLAFAPINGFDEIPAVASTVGGSLTAVDWFKTAIAELDSAILFLVGAPGNGKSYLLKKVTSGLIPLGDHSRDCRKFEYAVPNKTELIVINDASAPSSSENLNGSLVADISDAISGKKFLHVNVNKGVLYQELRMQIDNDPIRELIEWVSRPSDIQNPNWQYLNIQKPNLDSGTRCGKLSVDLDGEKTDIPIVIVLMDFYSIFELQPEHSLNVEGDWIGFPSLTKGEKFAIQSPRSDSRKSRDFWLRTPAGELLNSVVGQGHTLSLSQTPSSPYDSIRANLESLMTDENFCGVLSVLRNTELITSQHMSFRELWTAVATMIIGDGGARQAVKVSGELKMKPVDWIEKAISALPAEHSKERIKSLVQIASTRFHQSIFGAVQSPFEAINDLGVSPLLTLTRLTDPVRDVLPTASSANSRNFGWGGPLVNAFRGQIGDLSILETLKSSSIDVGLNFDFTPFDKALDDEIIAIIEADFKESPIIEKKYLESLLVWYGDYLARMFALSQGVTAFENELSDWVSAWCDAKSSKSLPVRVKKALSGMLLPTFKSSSQREGDRRMVSFLTSRTESITTKSPSPRLAIEISSVLLFRAEAVGDEIIVQVRDDQGEILVKFDLDFTLLREALTLSDWPESVTEFSRVLKPKIERLRASMLNRKTILSNIRLIDGSEVERVQVK